MSEKLWGGIPRSEEPWFPIINVDLCNGCQSCMDIEEQLHRFPHDYIDTIKNDPAYLNYVRSDKADQYRFDKEARIWALIQQLNFTIPNRRLAVLMNQSGDDRSPPYNHLAIRDLKLTDDFLVPMREFLSQGSALVRYGYAFTIVPPVESTNSQYWLVKMLYIKELQEFTFVRLDPFIFDEVKISRPSSTRCGGMVAHLIGAE